jgi:hypothetical protein
VRTPEQVKADEQLTGAILACRTAYGFEEGNLLTDYIVLTAEQGFDSDGDPRTWYCWLYRDGHIPYYRSIGLLEMVGLILRTQATSNGESG